MVPPSSSACPIGLAFRGSVDQSRRRWMRRAVHQVAPRTQNWTPYDLGPVVLPRLQVERSRGEVELQHDLAVPTVDFELQRRLASKITTSRSLMGMLRTLMTRAWIPDSGRRAEPPSTVPSTHRSPCLTITGIEPEPRTLILSHLVGGHPGAQDLVVRGRCAADAWWPPAAELLPGCPEVADRRTPTACLSGTAVAGQPDVVGVNGDDGRMGAVRRQPKGR